MVEKPFSNATRILLDADNYIDIFHESTQGSPLKAANISISSYSTRDLVVNSPPTSISISDLSLIENIPGNSIVGTLSSVDIDSGEIPVYSLAIGLGDSDNNRFEITGSQLRIKDSPDHESQSSYSIRLRSTDASGLYSENSYVLNVNNLNEAPCDVLVSSGSFNEHLPSFTIVSMLNTLDPDYSDTFAYSLAVGMGDTDNSAFTIKGDQLTINTSPDFETKSSYSIRVRTTDAGGLSFERELNLSVNDLPDPITGVATHTGGTGSQITLAASDDIINFSAPAFSELRTTPISGFDPANDIMSLDRTTFVGISSNSLFAVKALVPTGNKKLDKKAKKAQAKLVKRIGRTGDPLIYNQMTGQLIYDQNGSAPGFGAGGAFATLADKPLLTNSNLLLA